MIMDYLVKVISLTVTKAMRQTLFEGCVDSNL